MATVYTVTTSHPQHVTQRQYDREMERCYAEEHFSFGRRVALGVIRADDQSVAYLDTMRVFLHRPTFYAGVVTLCTLILRRSHNDQRTAAARMLLDYLGTLTHAHLTYDEWQAFAH